MSSSKKRYYLLTMYVTVISVLLLFCIKSGDIHRSTLDVLRVCAVSVIPSLFPFMVISSILTQTAPFLFNGIRSDKTFFGLPPCSVIPIFLGALCGFPVGVMTTAGLKDNRMLTDRQADIIAPISDNTGPAFIIEVIGAGFWKSRETGIRLYAIQIISSLLIGAVYIAFSSLLSGDKGSPKIIENSKERDVTKNEATAIFSNAVSSSALSVIMICGFIVFFSAITSLVPIIFPTVSPTAYTVITSVLEFTAGCRSAASVGSRFALAATSFSIGFGGISVLSQCMLVTAKSGLSVKKIFIFKILQGLLCAVLGYLFL